MESSSILKVIRIVYDQVARPRLELKPWGLLIILPQGYNEKYAYQLIKKHEKWIKEKYAILSKALELAKKVEIVNRSLKEFKQTIKQLVNEYSKELGVKVNRIYIRDMNTKWASCSPKGNISINKIAKFLPEDLLKYIIYHEMCHLLEKRHNTKFWSLIAKKLPNYQELELKLLAYLIKLKYMNTFSNKN